MTNLTLALVDTIGIAAVLAGFGVMLAAATARRPVPIRIRRRR